MYATNSFSRERNEGRLRKYLSISIHNNFKVSGQPRITLIKEASNYSVSAIDTNFQSPY